MPSKPPPSALEQLPPGEYIFSMNERLKLFRADPIARLALGEGQSAERVYRKDIKHIVGGEVEGEKSKSRNVIDVKQLTTSVRTDTNALASRLKRVGLANQVSHALTEHKGTLDVANALIALAKKGPDRLAKDEATELASEVKTLAEIQDREAAGGHPAFDLPTSNAAKTCWTHLDTATLLFGACLLKHGIVDDPVYASRPTVKSVLRPVLELPVGKKAASKHKKSTSKKTEKPGNKETAPPAKPPPTQAGSERPVPTVPPVNPGPGAGPLKA